MELLPAEPPSLLAAQARAVTRRLAATLNGPDRGSPSELARTVCALRLLTDDVVRLLPALQDQLEDGLLDGEVTRGERGAEADLDAVSAVGNALAHAQVAGQLVVRELESAQVVLGGLAAP